MVKPTSLSQLLSEPFDTIIDVRSPSEFAQDHIPGALNLPVLSDAQRVEIGTLYKQVSQFRARKLGAAMVFRNAAHHIETALSDKPGHWRPLVYCWRGGQRSGAFAWMLSEIGWRTDRLEGGYKSFRQLVAHALYEDPWPFRLIKLAGYTGTAKTDLLARLDCAGAQVIDLEKLANHRGSLLGALDTPQPTQKAFETALATHITSLSPDRPVFIEAESSKIGQLSIPPVLWASMRQAPAIEITAPLAARADYLAKQYASVLADGSALMDRLEGLRQLRGEAVLRHWADLVRANDKPKLCAALVAQHYDVAYRRALRAAPHQPVAQIDLADLSDASLECALQNLLTHADRIDTLPDPRETRPIKAAE